MAKLLPIGDATELPFEAPNTSGLDKGLRAPTAPPADLGARGPQYNRNSFQGPQQPAGMRAPTPVADALAAEARAPTGPAAKPGILDADVGKAASRGLRSAGSAVTNAAKSVASGVGRVVAPLTLGATAAEVASTPTEDYYQRTGIEPEATVVPQVMKDVGVRALGAAQDFGNMLTGGLADKVGNFAAGNGFERSAANPAREPAIRLASPTASGADAAAAAYPEPQQIRGSMPPGAQTPPAGVLTTGNPSSPEPDVQGIEQRASDIRSSMIPIQQQLDRFGPGVGGGGMAGLGGSQVERNKQFDREVLAGKIDQAVRLGGRRGAAAAQAYVAQLDGMNKRDDVGSAERIATLRDRGETTRATADRASREALAANNNAVSLRGQDLDLAGRKMTVDAARATSIREQGNKDRDFAAGRDDKVVERRNAASKALPDEIAGMLPPGADGKPDLANAARHAQGITNAVADLAKSHPDPAMRERLSREGLAALDQSDKRRLVAGMQLADIVNETATGGFTPWGTRAIQSNAPILAIKKLANGDYQTNRRGVNGETEIIPGRYIEKEGSTFGIGGRPSDKFKALME